jgi:prophage tail gpP-like protein
MVGTDRYDSIGSGLDRVELRIGGDAIRIWCDYEIHTSVFSQPGAFSMRVGWGDVARELLETYHPNATFQLFVGDVQIMSGVLDTPDVPRANATELSITGRDGIAALFDDHIQAEQSFHESSYFDLTEKMLYASGIESFALSGDNTANRKAVTGHTVTEIAKPVSGAEIEVEEAPQPGQTERRVVYKTIRAKLTESRWAFLEREYKRAGLFLWCAGDGNYVLARPNPAQEPGYLIQRERGMLRNQVNVVDITTGGRRSTASRVRSATAALVAPRWGAARSARSSKTPR